VQDTLHYVEKAGEQLLVLSELRRECEAALTEGLIKFGAHPTLLFVLVFVIAAHFPPHLHYSHLFTYSESGRIRTPC
jgi:hypothetical protein